MRVSRSFSTVALGAAGWRASASTASCGDAGSRGRGRQPGDRRRRAADPGGHDRHEGSREAGALAGAKPVPGSFTKIEDVVNRGAIVEVATRTSRSPSPSSRRSARAAGCRRRFPRACARSR